ncbi:MAG: hypothetical protein NC081_04540 [Roseburia sp.]|nr:hypothetical protein [Roseburia sp.]
MNDALMIVGIAMIVLAIALFVLDFCAYARKRMNESFGMIWMWIALVFLILGVVLLAVPKLQTVWAAGIIYGLILIFLIFKVTKVISVLVMKTQELAMQVSLLNQENERILQEIADIKEQAGND